MRYFVSLKTSDGGERTYPLGPKHYPAVKAICDRSGVTVEDLVKLCVGTVSLSHHGDGFETFTVDRHTSRCLRHNARLAGHPVGTYVWRHLIIGRAESWAGREASAT